MSLISNKSTHCKSKYPDVKLICPYIQCVRNNQNYLFNKCTKIHLSYKQKLLKKQTPPSWISHSSWARVTITTWWQVSFISICHVTLLNIYVWYGGISGNTKHARGDPEMGLETKYKHSVPQVILYKTVLI